MDSRLVMSSHNASSLTIGANLWNSKHPTNSIYNARFRTSKVSQHRREIQIENNVPRFQVSSLNHRYKYIEGKVTHQERNKKYIVQAIPTASFNSEPSADDYVKNFLDVCYKLCSPYALIGVTLAATSSSFLAVEKLSDISLPFIINLFQALVSHIFVAFYVGAVNQLFDFEIDKINKPHLPLAAGKSSLTTVVVISALSLTLSLGITWVVGSWPLFWNTTLNAAVWSIYSFNVPLLRWKRHPVLSAICHILGGGIVIPISLFLHAQNFVLKRPITVSRSLITTVLFMSIYFLTISMAKDINDVEGDKAYGIDTFAIRLGKERVFRICIFLLEMAFGVAFLAGVTSPYLWIKIVTGVGSVVLASNLWYQAKSTDLNNNSSVGSFYMFIWKTMYAAQFLLALIR